MQEVPRDRQHHEENHRILLQLGAGSPSRRHANATTRSARKAPPPRPQLDVSASCARAFLLATSRTSLPIDRVSRQFVNAPRHHDVLDRDPIRLEQCDLIRIRAPRNFSRRRFPPARERSPIAQRPPRTPESNRPLPSSIVRSESTTITSARRTASSSSSRFCGKFAPIALMCAPGFSHAPNNHRLASTSSP